MFCPKCGIESQETQKYCKACGTNLQVVNDALGSGEDTLGKLRVDFDSLIKDIGSGWDKEWGKLKTQIPTSGIKKHTQRENEPVYPKPKEWLRYSWQHNLRDGLISLFGGVGLGIALYYFAQTVSVEALIRSIDELADRELRNIEQLDRVVRMLWLFALVPVLKGIAQIIYAALFAESIGTLSERFAPRPQAPIDRATTGYMGLNEPPSSVTEHTTQFFEESQARKNRDTN